MRGHAEDPHPAGGVLDDEEAVQASEVTVSRWTRSQARIPRACAVRNSRQVGPDRRGAGSSPAVVRILHTVEAPTLWGSETVLWR